MDVVATTIVEETGKIILACGLSCCLSAVADVAMASVEEAITTWDMVADAVIVAAERENVMTVAAAATMADMETDLEDSVVMATGGGSGSY